MLAPSFFGTAIGKALEHALINIESNCEGTEEVFLKYWQEQEFNGIVTQLQHCKAVSYLKSDMDEELAETPWLSLKAKGLLIIKSFRDNLVPLIEHVYSTEEKVVLDSGTDSWIGYADAVVKLKGYDKPIVLDFKTASRPYEQDAVKESEQLSQYLYVLSDKYNTDLAGYAVFIKNINKNRKKVCSKCEFNGSSTRHKTCNNIVNDERCNGEYIETIHPTCTMQLLVDTIEIKKQEEIIDAIGTVNDMINRQEFIIDPSKCKNDGYGKPCMYYNVCFNNNTDEFVILPKSENKR